MGGFAAKGEGGERSAGSGFASIAEINVTPLVDVMLVLLVIVLVTTPLIQRGVEVDLPTTRAQAIESSEDKVVVSLTAKKRVFIGSTEVTLAELPEKLRANAKVARDREAFLEADRGLPYGFVMDVMAALKEAGIVNLGMITDPSQLAPGGSLEP